MNGLQDKNCDGLKALAHTGFPMHYGVFSFSTVIAQDVLCDADILWNWDNHVRRAYVRDGLLSSLI